MDAAMQRPMAPFEVDSTAPETRAAEPEARSRRGSDVTDVVAVFGERDEFPVCPWDPIGVKDLFRVPQYLPRVLVAITVYVCGMYVNCLAQAQLQRTMAHYYETHWQPVPGVENRTVILWDFGHELIPLIDSQKSWWLDPDLLAKLPPTFVSIRFWLVPGPVSLRWEIMSRWFTLLGVLFFLRSLCIVSTVLPNPDTTCVPRIQHPNNIWREAVVIFTHADVTCMDVLYSGHTTALTLGTLFAVTYSERAPWWSGAMENRDRWVNVVSMTRVAAVIYACVGYYAIIGTHFHYSADVLLGALVTLLIFKGYHYLIHRVVLKKADPWSPHMFIYWFEREALDLRIWQRVVLRRVSGVDSTFGV